MAPELSRRQLLAGVGAATAFAWPREASADAIAMLAGRVEAHGCGLAGVMVSNGRDVVLTAADGSWHLPSLAGRDVFVIKPAGYRVVGASDQDRGFFVPCGTEQPMGRPVVFTLEPASEPDRFNVLLMTDTQPDSHAELDYVRDDIFAGLLGHTAAFGIHHGDVVSDALDLFPRHQQLLGATGIPWHHCVGNHDIDRDATDAADTRATWRRTFGPRWYAFAHAKAMFFILDNIGWNGHDGGYRGEFGAEQLAFVAHVLARVPRDHLVVLSMHIPLRCYLAPDSASDTTSDWQALLRLLQGRPHAVSFSGHLHATEHHYLPLPDREGEAAHHHHVLTAGSGSWWSGPRDVRGIPSADSTDGSPNGFHVLRVDGNRYLTDFVPAAGKRPAPLRAMLQERTDAGEGPVLLVNVFDGGPRTRVQFNLGDGDWCAMRAHTCCDPLVSRMLQEHRPRKSWVEATPSSHIWSAPFPRQTPGRAAVVSLRITDEYGRNSETRVIVEA